MKKEDIVFNNIEDYIQNFPENIQKVLQELRQTIHKAAPDAIEIINYGIPTFYLKGNLVHFAAFKNHIGFYPTASGVEAFKENLLAYKTSKGAIQFPLEKPLPFTLISKIVKYRAKQNEERTGMKAKAKK